jgi:hypothetical protein
LAKARVAFEEARVSEVLCPHILVALKETARRANNDRLIAEKAARKAEHEAQEAGKVAKEAARVAKEAATGLEGQVVIIDGLDECEGADAQASIISIIATSIRHQKTPLRWMILSHFEPIIVASFEDQDVASVSLHITLPVTRMNDPDIMHFLMEELKKTARASRLSAKSWPSDEDLLTLVELSAGLWACAQTIVRFISIRNAKGPVAQLQFVLALRGCAQVTESNPLANLDLLYSRIMESVPDVTLPTIQLLILLSESMFPQRAAIPIEDIDLVSKTLAIPKSQIEHAFAALHAVMELDTSGSIHFYHASFTDFMREPNRSGKFCVFDQTVLISLKRSVLQQVIALSRLTPGALLSSG